MRLILFTLVAGPLLFLWLVATQGNQAALRSLPLDRVDKAELEEAFTSFAVLDTLPVVPLVMFAVPLLVAEVIPLDREYNVDDLLNALPLTQGTYLMGKLLSVLAPLFSLLMSVMLLTLGVGWVVRGSYHVGIVLELWLGRLMPFALFCSALSTLLGAGQPTRRRAVFIGIALFAVFAITFKLLLQDFYIAAVLKPLSVGARFGVTAYPDLFSGSYLATLGGALALVVLAWRSARWWVHRHANG
jgi:ABC-type transport system involved in multi-copper enzyme maturation permease subunit